MKLLFVGFLLFLGYRLMSPAKKDGFIDEIKKDDLDEAEYTDYEEVDD